MPLLVDEAHYVAGGENVVDQIATHRAAGLEPAFGLQYFAQLGSASEHQQKILKGVLNLLQSRFLFRMGDAEDAEQATRIAMAVYATMIRDDPDSRARLRVTPEQALNFPNYYCLASWIANGTRAPSFMGQTYPLPDVGDEWADYHLAAQDERVGPYPEELESTLDARARAAADGNGSRPTMAEPSQSASAREYLAVPYDEKDAAKRLGARWDPDAQRWFIPAGVDPEPLARWRVAVRTESDGTESSATGNGTGQAKNARAGRPADSTAPAQPSRNGRQSKREVRVDYEPPPEPPNLADSPIRRIVGQPVSGSSRPREDRPAPDSLRELAFLDRINEIGPAEQLPGADSLPRLYDEDYAVLALLDRVGLAPRSMIARAVFPQRTANAVIGRLTKLHRHGLIAQHTIGVRERAREDGKLPLLYSLTRRGLDVAQARQPAPAISPRREWRAIEQPHAGRLAHDLHALGWAIELHRIAGKLATDHWRTPRYATGRYPVPQTGSGQRRHPITLNEIRVPDGQAIIDLELKSFTEVKPDLSLELRIDTAEAGLRPSRRARPHRPPLLQPGEVPRLRRVPVRLEPRPPALPDPGHAARRRIRLSRPASGAGLRTRGRRSDDRPDRNDGHQRRALVLRRARPHVLRRRSGHPPRRPVGARAPRPAARTARAAHRQPRTRAEPNRATAGQPREALRHPILRSGRVASGEATPALARNLGPRRTSPGSPIVGAARRERPVPAPRLIDPRRKSRQGRSVQRRKGE